MSKTKKFFIVAALTVAMLMAMTLSGCTYDVPAGYTKQHHPYLEMVEYAKSIDPNAAVSEDYKDINENYRDYRIWPAVINGKECSVASISVNIYNQGWAAGEFSKRYYRMDTDYDYLVINDVLKEHPDLGQVESNLQDRYEQNGHLYGVIRLDTITEDKLIDLWEEHNEVNKELAKYNLRKVYRLRIKIGEKTYWDWKNNLKPEEDFETIRDRMVQDGLFE
jgi:hypothetical protein